MPKPPFLPDDLIAALTGQEPPAAPGKPGKDKSSKPRQRRAADTTDAAKHSIHAVQMIRAYRMIGHLEADLDPLGITRRTPQPTLDPKTYGFDGAGAGPADLCRRRAGH